MTEKISFWLTTFVFAMMSIVRTAQKCCKSLTTYPDPNDPGYNDYDYDENMSRTDADESVIGAATPKNSRSWSKKKLTRTIRTVRNTNQIVVTVKRDENNEQPRLSRADALRRSVDYRSQLAELSREGKRQFWRAVIDYSITFNSSFLIVGGLSESYLYGVRMLGNILSVCIGHVYALLVIYPFMYSLSDECRTPYHYLKLRYRHPAIKLACLLVGLFYYFSFLSLYLWGCAAILNLLMPEIDLQTANFILGVFSIFGTLLGGFLQSSAANLVQFVVVFLGIVLGMRLTLDNSEAFNTIDKMWTFATEHNRTTVFDRNVDISTR